MLVDEGLRRQIETTVHGVDDDGLPIVTSIAQCRKGSSLPIEADRIGPMALNEFHSASAATILVLLLEDIAVNFPQLTAAGLVRRRSNTIIGVEYLVLSSEKLRIFLGHEVRRRSGRDRSGGNEYSDSDELEHGVILPKVTRVKKKAGHKKIRARLS